MAKSTKEKRNLTKIDVTTVLDVMLQSERDKHDARLDECLSFCHTNLDLVLNHHGNAILDLNDCTIKKLAFLFHHHEVEAIRDKKDRIKSKMYRYLTERALQSDAEPLLGCPESGSTLFRCELCGQLLTINMANKVKCRPGHYSLDKHGTMVPCHIQDQTWDVQTYIRELFNNHITWKRIYWIIWGQIHFLACDRCKETVPCYQISQCYYHPEPAIYSYDRDSNVLQPVGRFPCCTELACRFDPWEILCKGCRRRDHLINPKDSIQQQIYQDLVHHREMICSASDTLDLCDTRRASNANWSNSDKMQTGNNKPGNAEMSSNTSHSEHHPDNKHRDEDDRSSVGRVNEDDDDEENEYPSDEGSVATDTSSNSSEKLTMTVSCEEESHANNDKIWKVGQHTLWDTSRSRRHNHDVLREREQRRFQEIVGQLLQVRTTNGFAVENDEDLEHCTTVTNNNKRISNSRLGPSSLRIGGPPWQNSGRQRQVFQQQQNGHSGGSYARVEAQWKSEHPPATSVQMQFPQRASVIAIARFKRGKKGSA